jgi:hypothetical protein
MIKHLFYYRLNKLMDRTWIELTIGFRFIENQNMFAGSIDFSSEELNIFESRICELCGTYAKAQDLSQQPERPPGEIAGLSVGLYTDDYGGWAETLNDMLLNLSEDNRASPEVRAAAKNYLRIP